MGILAGVNSTVLRQRLATAIAVALVLLSGCAPFLATPPTAPTNPTTAATPTSAPKLGEPVLLPTASPMPTPSIATTLRVTDAPLQFWSNPNEIVGLVADGESIWAATLGGVVRWWPDGRNALYTVETGMLSQAIDAIARDADGHIWVAYRDILTWSEFDGTQWIHYPTRQDAVEARYPAMLAAHSAEPKLWSSRADSTWLWLPKGDGQVQAYDGTRWRSYGESHGITPGTWGVGVGPGGQVWAVGRGVATASEGDLWWDDSSFFSSIASSDLVTDLAVDSEGSVWVSFVGERGAEGGVARYSPALERWEGYQHALNPTIPTQVYSVSLSANGELVLCGEGAVVMRPVGRAWQQLAVPGIEVRCLAQDSTGLLWLGATDGLYSIHADGTGLEGPWTVPTPLRDNAVRALLITADDTLIVGGERGVTIIRPDGTVAWAEQAGTRCGTIDDVGDVWLGGDEGLFRLDLATAGLQRVSELPVLSLAASGGQLIALGVDGFLYRQPQSAPEAWLDGTALMGSAPRNLAVTDDGNLWLSTETGAGMVTPEGALTRWTRDDGLLSNDVRAVIASDDGVVWCATAMGLARRKPDGNWTRFTVESTGGGLRSLDMVALMVEPDGTLWMATALGISRRSPEADWAYYDLAGIEHMAIDAHGILWLGSDSGLYRLDPSALTPVAD